MRKRNDYLIAAPVVLTNNPCERNGHTCIRAVIASFAYGRSQTARLARPEYWQLVFKKKAAGSNSILSVALEGPIFNMMFVTIKESRARRLAAHTIAALARVIARLLAVNTLWSPIRLHL